jgi:hypothetical protein
MKRNGTSSKAKRLRGQIAVALLIASAATAAGSFAAQAQVAETLNRFVFCFGLMIVDPPAHGQECLPSNIPGSLSSLALPVTDGGQPVPTKSPIL